MMHSNGRLIETKEREKKMIKLSRLINTRKKKGQQNRYSSSNKHHQSGRSMTEMLGVLAVIGVLSIGSVIGYGYAMDKYRANETINELNTYALIVDGQMLNGKTIFDLSEAGNRTRLGYPVSAYLLDDPSYFEIALEQVPVGVCKQILSANWNKPLVIYANDFAYNGNNSICEQDDEGTPASMKFQFYAALTEGILPYGTCETPADCFGNCVDCQKGLCVSLCTGSERCATDINSGAEVCCPSDKRSGPYCCPSAVNGWCCDENKENCCPWHKPLRDKNGTCYSCDYEAGVDVTGVPENCNACTNRELDGNKCVLQCPAETPVRDSNGKCRSCFDEDPFPLASDKLAKECIQKCPNRVLNGWADRYCAYDLCGQGIFKDKPLTNRDGKCFSCNNEKSLDVGGVTHEGCDVCENRYLANGFCILNCQDGEFRDKDGICRSCEDEKSYNFGSGLINGCIQMCPNRVLNGWLDLAGCSYDLCGQGIFKDKPLTDSSGNCHSCDEEENINVVGVSHEGCEQCQNRYLSGEMCILDCPEGQFKDSNGKCQSCESQEAFYFKGNVALANNCIKRCPNRVLNGYLDTACSYNLCGQGIFKDKPLTEMTGKCYSCDEPRQINTSVSHEGCEVCSERVLYDNHCSLKCPDETPLLGSNNKCYPCDTEERVNVSYVTDSCFECPNERKLDGNYCVLK